MATIQERKNKSGKISYTAIIRLKGYPTQTATFNKKSLAKEWIQKTEQDLKQGKSLVYSVSNRLTLNDIINRYLSEELPKRRSDHQKYKTQLSWWGQNLGFIYLKDLKPSVIVEYQNKLQIDLKISNSTVNRYTAALSIVLSIATREWEFISENPVLKIKRRKEPKGRVRFLTDQERIKLIKACKESPSKYLYPIVILALSTGARSAEIRSLKWENIDFDRKLIYIIETKNGESRSIPMSTTVHKLLITLQLNKSNNTYLFPGEKGNYPVSIRRSWDNSLERAGIGNFRFHDLRHTAASYLAMNGATLIELSHILGHKTLQMVKRYSHFTEQHTATLIERMNQKCFN